MSELPFTDDPVEVARRLCLHLGRMLWGEGEQRFCRLFEIEGAQVGRSSAVEDFLTECPDHLVAPALLMLMVEDEITGNSPAAGVIDIIAGECEVDLEVIKAEVKDAMRAEAELEPEPPKKGGKAAGKPKPKKTTAKDAKAGIAKAMQERDGDQVEKASAPQIQVGASVRIGDTVRPIKIRGQEGTVASHVFADDWIVTVGGKGYRLSTSQFEALPAAAPQLSTEPAWPFPMKSGQQLNGDSA